MPTDEDDEIFITEQRYFWCAVGELREAAHGGDGDVIRHHLYEIDGIRFHTRSALIRRRCDQVMAQFRPYLFGYAHT